MFLYISINNNYPYKFYGEFIASDSGDYLFFLEGKYLKETPEFKVIFNILNQDIEKLLKWDILSVDRGIFFANKRFRKFLQENVNDEVQFIKSKLFTKEGKEIDGYELLNVTNKKLKKKFFITRKKAFSSIYIQEELAKKIQKEKFRGWTFGSD